MKEEKTFKVWISKNALTLGIFEKEVQETHSSDMVSTVNQRWVEFYFKPYWHLTKDEAIKHADEMRIKKLQNLDKQIKKISSLKFD